MTAKEVLRKIEDTRKQFLKIQEELIKNKDVIVFVGFDFSKEGYLVSAISFIPFEKSISEDIIKELLLTDL